MIEVRENSYGPSYWIFCRYYVRTDCPFNMNDTIFWQCHKVSGLKLFLKMDYQQSASQHSTNPRASSLVILTKDKLAHSASQFSYSARIRDSIVHRLFLSHQPSTAVCLYASPSDRLVVDTVLRNSANHFSLLRWLVNKNAIYPSFSLLAMQYGRFGN